MKMFNENVRRCVAFHADHPRIRQILGHRQSNFTFDFQNVQPEQTMVVIKKLNIKKTIGYDANPAKFLRDCDVFLVNHT